MEHVLIPHLGPLAALAGIWEGQKGEDVAPSDDRGTERNHFRERMTFDPMGPVRNHEQTLYGLRYATMVWRIGEADPFHEELGYKCFAVSLCLGASRCLREVRSNLRPSLFPLLRTCRRTPTAFARINS